MELVHSTSVKDCTAHGDGAIAHGDGAIALRGSTLTIKTAHLLRCAANSTGAALWVHNSTFDIQDTTIEQSAAVDGALLYYESALSQQPSTLASMRFVNNTAKHAVVAYVPINWTCNLGQWASQSGIVQMLDFDGCPNACAPGFVGNITSSTIATCGGACPVGHTCPAGTIVPQPCPRGTHMPTTGAGDNTSCIPCAPGQFAPFEGTTRCTACPRGFYSPKVGAHRCTCLLYTSPSPRDS